MGQIKNIKLHIVTDIKENAKTTPIMQIFVQSDKTDVYDVSPSITVGDLKELISFRSGLAYEEQVLMFAGRPLNDEHTLSEDEINEVSTLFLGERLLGGKVHGSLVQGRSKVKHQRLMHKKRRNLKQVERSGELNTTIDLLMLLLLLVHEEVPTQMLLK